MTTKTHKKLTFTEFTMVMSFYLGGMYGLAYAIAYLTH